VKLSAALLLGLPVRISGALHMVKFCGIAFLIIVLRLLCLSEPAGAEPLAGVGGTTVTVDGTTVTIHVQIEVFGLEGQKINDDTGESFDAASYIQREVSRIWNEALKGVNLGDCLTFKLDLQIKALKDGAPKQPGWHHVILDKGNDNNYWNSSGPDDLVPTLDNPFPYQREFNGVWNTPYPYIIAHEVGHVLGLGDDYYISCKNMNDRSTCYTSGYKPTGETIPDAPLLGIVDPNAGTFTTDGTGIPDPVTVYRIIQQIRAAGLLPQCWKGTMKISTDSYKLAQRCTDSWTADMKVVVSDKGVASGSGTAHRASAVVCVHATPCATPQVFTFRIGGESDRQSFRLKYTTTGATPAGSCDYTAFGTVLPGFPKQRVNTIPIVGASRAEAHYQVIEFFNTAKGSFDTALDCTSCDTHIK
jgi:hypothetical protein